MAVDDMKQWSIDELKLLANRVVEQIPYLELLVLFGSRARDDHHPCSDWDFALLFNEELRQQHEQEGWSYFRSWSVLQQVFDLGDEEMDWVELKNASDLLAHAIARDGVVIYEDQPGLFEQFRQNALMTPRQLKAIRLEQEATIAAALKQWGL
jgi:predicted nucleotidyltransferase